MDPEQPVVTDDMAALNPEGGVVMSFRLQIPNSVVGSIIGKSGEIIKSIRDQSGARVIIADSQPGEDRDVTIKVFSFFFFLFFFFFFSFFFLFFPPSFPPPSPL